MTRDEAFQIARSMIGPAAMLGYLVGRGSAWPTGEAFKTYTRAIGEVMGRTYHVLGSVWREYPDLDPGRNTDPLSLLDREAPPDPARPSDLLRYITELDGQLEVVANKLESNEAETAELRIALENLRSLLTASRV